jgi:hypothetical protein
MRTWTASISPGYLFYEQFTVWISQHIEDSFDQGWELICTGMDPEEMNALEVEFIGWLMVRNEPQRWIVCHSIPSTGALCQSQCIGEYE